MAYGNATDNGSASSADLRSFLTDVPFIAIGILGFAAAKLLFSFNGMTRGSLLILLSVFTAFLAVIFEAFRIFRPNGCPDEVMGALACLRGVFLSVSIFIRYIFFLDYSARWPRRIDGKRVCWWERPAFRAICDGAFLFLAVAILVLQLVWRLAHLQIGTIVYTVDAALEIAWTTLLALRLCGSFSTSRIVGDTPACATLLPPVGAALLIEWGISVGNAVAFDFADCVTGRFLQAAEAYIILLALMTATFSTLISPASMSRDASLAGSRKKPWTLRILGRGNDMRQDDVEKQQQSPQSRVSVELDFASVESGEIVQWRKREALGRDSALISDAGASSLHDLSMLRYPADGSEGRLNAPPTLALQGVLASLTLPPRMGSVRTNRTVGNPRATRRSSAPTIMVTSGSDLQDLCARRAVRSAIGSSVPQYTGTLDTFEVASRNRDSQPSVSNAPGVAALRAPKGGGVGSKGLLDQARVEMGQSASNFIYHARQSMHGEISQSSLPSSPVPALDACPPTTLSVLATSPFAREGLRIVTDDLVSSPRSTPSATQWDVTAFISEMSHPPKATAPPASALSDIDLDRRGPISTASLAPSPVLPRPPPRMQLRRNADVFTTLVSAMGYSKDMTEPEPRGGSAHLPFDLEPARPADHEAPEPRVA